MSDVATVPPPLIRNGVSIDATYAEAFDMRATALVITAPTLRWARIAATSTTGFATSVIACGVEAGIDAEMAPETTPDGRPGVRVLLFAGSTTELQKQLTNRVGQCVLTSPGSACYSGLAGTEPLKLGDGLRYFADGFQISKRLPDRHLWRLPVMDGEFVCEGTTGLTRTAVGGGNLIVMGRTSDATLVAAEAASDAVAAVSGAIAPFPGGIARSGSKVGSKYKGLMASTNHAYCPTLRGLVPDSALGPEIGAVLELVIDGLTPEAVAAAMRAGLAAVVALGPERGALRVGAGNYGGKLGRHHFHLHELAPEGGVMTALRLVLRGEVGQRLDLSPLTPDRLTGLDLAAVAALPLHTTRHRVTVGDIFHIHSGDPAEIVIEGGSERFDRVGEAMQTGTLTVEGDVGQQAGRLMAGGKLVIRGNAGGWVASGLRGGTLEIGGDAGEFLGGPLVGERTGMRGGVVVVRGRAGMRAADRLRRGLVIVEGDAGPHAGSGIVAGTLVVCGAAGALPGILMRRGTIVLGKPADLAPTFIATEGAELLFTRLLARAAAPFSAKAAACVGTCGTRYAGDMAVLGKGELFVSG